jgi:broad specificity phosphatase PhoE
VPRIYLVRHGRATGGFGVHSDPGLDETGHRQALSVAKRLLPLGPLPILSSPLARAQQTALPLAGMWSIRPAIVSAVAEIPAPSDDLHERAVWLREFLKGSWRSAGLELAQWRENVVATVAAQTDDVVIFTHFLAINAAVGAATSEARVAVFSPANCSVTIVEAQNGILRLIEKGYEESLTRIG